MLLQARLKKLKKWKENKKGISVVIGYVLLVTFAVTISVIVYQWLKSYVPTASVECPDGVSMSVKNYTYDCTNKQLSITLKNNGVFNISGYYIYATTSQDQQLATTDLSANVTGTGKHLPGSTWVTFKTGDNLNEFKPTGERTDNFNLAGFTTKVDGQQVYAIEITPTRYDEVDGKTKFAGCTKAKFREEVSCTTS